ncbi:MAG TPA: HEAT repeat domain-containing protein, partial [Planctomycetaceae bacterium]
MPRLRFPATALAAVWMLGLAWWAGSARSDSTGHSTGPAIGNNNEEVSELIASLDDPRSAIRREAAVRLARLGPSASEAIPGVTSRLDDEDPFVRAHAARAACRLGASPDIAVRVLSLLLQPDEQQLCCLASLILGEIGSRARPAVPALVNCVKSSNASIRLHAAEAMLKIDSTDWTALRELMAGMASDSADLRYFAANALGESALDNEQAILALQRALTDEDMNVAITAALNLSKRLHLPRGGAANVPEIEELGRLIENLRDPLPGTRQTAAIRLGMAGPAARRAGSALLDLLTDPDVAVRVHVAHALWQIERPAGAVVPVLIDLLGVSQSNVRIAATYVLGEIGPAAGDALPALYDMFAGSRLRDRLLLSMVISLVEPRDREMVGILISGLYEQAGDVRYQSAIALGSAPVAHQRRVERALTEAAGDRNLRVQSAAAEALSRFELRIHEARNALSAQYASSFGSPDAIPVTTTSILEQRASSPPEYAGPPDASENSSAAENESTQRELLPPIGNIAQREVPIPLVPGEDLPGQTAPGQILEEYEDPGEVFRPLKSVPAMIRPKPGDEPLDYARAHFLAFGDTVHELGMTRGWSTISYGWDPPALYYQPVYFEEINHERYGIHNGLLSPISSFGKFFGTFPILPYKLITQPMCECRYTLGFERPNNCVPVHCYGWGSLNKPFLWWFSRHNYC